MKLTTLLIILLFAATANAKPINVQVEFSWSGADGVFRLYAKCPRWPDYQQVAVMTGAKKTKGDTWTWSGNIKAKPGACDFIMTHAPKGQGEKESLNSPEYKFMYFEKETGAAPVL